MKDKAVKEKSMGKTIKTVLSVIYLAGIAFVIAIYIKAIYNVEYFAVFDSQEQAFTHILFSIVDLLFISIAGMLLQTIIHEAGHLIFGLLTGYKFSSFRAFIFELYKKNGRLRFKLSAVPGTLGQCLMLPPGFDNGKYPTLLYNLGGVFTNIISGAALTGVYFSIRETPFSACAVLLIAVSGFFFALGNGIPIQAKVNNDGYNTVELSKSNGARFANWCLLRINDSLNNGVELKDMPEEWFCVSDGEKFGSSMEASVACLTGMRLLEERRFDDADRLMARLLEHSSVINVYQREILICERTFYELVNQNRREVIEEMRTEDQKEFLRKARLTPTVMRTEYAYALLAEKDLKKADEIRAKFEKGFAKYADKDTVKLNLEMMELAKSKAACSN